MQRGKTKKSTKKEYPFPTFTLKATDKLSVDLIKKWITDATLAGVKPGKLFKARKALLAFEEFQGLNPEKVKLPD